MAVQIVSSLSQNGLFPGREGESIGQPGQDELIEENGWQILYSLENNSGKVTQYVLDKP